MFLIIQKDTNKNSFFKNETFSFYSDFTTLQDFNKNYVKGKHKYVVDCSGSAESGLHKTFAKRGFSEYKETFLLHKGDEVNYIFFDYDFIFEKAKFLPEGLKKAEIEKKQVSIKDFFATIVKREQMKNKDEVTLQLKAGINITQCTGDSDPKKNYILTETSSDFDLENRDYNVEYISLEEVNFIAKAYTGILKAIGSETPVYLEGGENVKRNGASA